jgi:hypothetical protein
MMYFLNKGLILEEEIVKTLKKYFSSLDIDKMFENYTLNITNEHPFAQLLDNQGESNSPGLFPAVVVTSETDDHIHGANRLLETEPRILEPSDVDQLVPYGYLIDPETVERIRGEFTGRNELYGATFIIRRTERISIQIWADNVQLKNYLYEMIRLYILGAMHDEMEVFRKGNNLIIFDETVTGQRSGTYSNVYGITLYGSNIVFDADYMIEQTFIDTELVKIKANLEVIYESKQ